MNTSLTSSAGAVLGVFYDAFVEFASTLDYPIGDIKITSSAKPFTFHMTWACPEVHERFTYEDITWEFKHFALDLFKSFGFLVVVKNPELV